MMDWEAQHGEWYKMYASAEALYFSKKSQY